MCRKVKRGRVRRGDGGGREGGWVRGREGKREGVIGIMQITQHGPHVKDTTCMKKIKLAISFKLAFPASLTRLATYRFWNTNLYFLAGVPICGCPTTRCCRWLNHAYLCVISMDHTCEQCYCPVGRDIEECGCGREECVSSSSFRFRFTTGYTNKSRWGHLTIMWLCDCHVRGQHLKATCTAQGWSVCHWVSKLVTSQ